MAAVYLCHCLKSGALGGLAFPISKARDFITGVLFWLSKKSFDVSDSGKPQVQRIRVDNEGHCCLYLLPLPQAYEDYTEEECLPAQLFCSRNNSMALKCSISKQP